MIIYFYEKLLAGYTYVRTQYNINMLRRGCINMIHFGRILLSLATAD
jgi:hypothetical protein